MAIFVASNKFSDSACSIFFLPATDDKFRGVYGLRRQMSGKLSNHRRELSHMTVLLLALLTKIKVTETLELNKEERLVDLWRER